MATHTDTAHGAALPIGADARVFGFFDHAALWFSLGVGLLVMQVGSLLMPALGPPQALADEVHGRFGPLSVLLLFFTVS